MKMRESLKMKMEKIDLNLLKKLGNTIPGSYNASALRIKKYYKNQQPPTSLDKPWKDNLFQPIDNSIHGKDANGKFTDPNKARREESIINTHGAVDWLRAEEIFPYGYSLFEDKIEFADVLQGQIGDCYFMAALASL